MIIFFFPSKTDMDLGSGDHFFGQPPVTSQKSAVDGTEKCWTSPVDGWILGGSYPRGSCEDTSGIVCL